jgi:hypothetical protein
MLKAVSALVMAAGLAAFIALPGAAPASGADTAHPLAKGDRLPVRSAAACSQRAWPHYDQNCLIGHTRSPGVRIVSAERAG